jgi:3-hydroxyisobutyrate dehydrogenase-like beta-hydroxyacid dehydrogenase
LHILRHIMQKPKNSGTRIKIGEMRSLRRLIATTRRPQCYHTSRLASSIGFVGVGHMGGKIAVNIAADKKCRILAFDRDSDVLSSVVTSSDGSVVASDMSEIASDCDLVFSMLPNDAAVSAVSSELLSHGKKGLIHVSCSTVSPNTSRRLAKEYRDEGKTFIASPVFARPDGIAKKQAVWMISGDESGRKVAADHLESGGRVVDYGDDTGAANIVKLCGNFLIASTIESISESMALAEKHGVQREGVMDLLSSTIFDCLIYKGYGDRVSRRDHRPGGFSLELGLKDVKLVQETAQDAGVPMPFLSTLVDRFTSAKANGRSDFDWSAIGLSVAEDAGIDVRKDVERTKEQIERGEMY